MFDLTALAIVSVISLFVGSLGGLLAASLCNIAHGSDAHIPEYPEWLPEPHAKGASK